MRREAGCIVIPHLQLGKARHAETAGVGASLEHLLRGHFSSPASPDQ